MQYAIRAGRSEASAKRSLVKVDVVPGSQLPFRVTKRSNGMIMRSFETRKQAEDYIDSLPLEMLRKKSTRIERS